MYLITILNYISRHVSMNWPLLIISYLSLLLVSLLFNNRRGKLGRYIHYALYYIPYAVWLLVYGLFTLFMFLLNQFFTSWLFFHQVRIEDCPVGEENRISAILTPVDLLFQFDDDRFISADGIFILKEKFSFEKFKSAVLYDFAFAKDDMGRLLYPKLTQVVREGPLFSTWEYFPNFNINHHLTEKWLDLSSSNEFQTFLNETLSSRIPVNQPGFQFIVIHDKNKQEDDEGSVTYVLYRLDHTMGDGITFVRIFINSLGKPLDESDSTKLDEMFKKYSKSQYDLSVGKLLLLALLSPIYMADFFLLEPKSFFKRQCIGKKCVSYSPPIDFTKIATIKNRTNTTVNDVFLMLLGQTLQSYMIETGEDPNNFVWISFLQAISLKVSLAGSMSNNFAGIRIKIPLDILNWREQLTEINSDMLSMKFSLKPLFNTLTVPAFAYLPRRIRNRFQMLIFDYLLCGGFTNIPGPDVRMTLAGTPIDHFVVFMPLFGNIALSCGFISFRKKVCMSFITDQALCNNPKRLTEHFIKNLDDIYGQVLQIS